MGLKEVEGLGLDELLLLLLLFSRVEDCSGRVFSDVGFSGSELSLLLFLLSVLGLLFIVIIFFEFSYMGVGSGILNLVMLEFIVRMIIILVFGFKES